jgi:endonuclease-3
MKRHPSRKKDLAYVKKVLKLLKKRYASVMHTALDYRTPFQLLVATILSAQSQDVKVNMLTPKLFRDFPNPKSYVGMKASDLYPYIRHLGLYQGKSKNIIKTADFLCSRFGSRVPKTIEELTTLPGVGRKTANVVLSNAYGITEGIAIDTHCITVSNRLGLATTNNPAKIESGLMDIVPRSEWGNISNLFIALGRDTCQARIKKCNECILKDICPSSDWKKPK